VRERIGRKMLDVLDRYARENGYSAIFDTSSQAQVIIYASNQADVTQDIIRLFDQAYPLRRRLHRQSQQRQSQLRQRRQPSRNSFAKIYLAQNG